MASYHTIEDVRSLLNAQNIPLTPTSSPSEAEVQEWMEQVEGYVNARLKGAGISLPITDSDGLKVLKLICSNLTAARVFRRVVRQRAPESRDYAAELEEQAEKLLQAIEKGILLIHEASSVDSPLGYFGEDCERKFKVGEQA